MYVIDHSKKNNWYIKGNLFSTSLMHFYVEIIPNEVTNHFILRAINSDTDIKELCFEFPTLEDAIKFTDEVIRNCWTYDDIVKGYKDYFEEQNKVLKKTR